MISVTSSNADTLKKIFSILGDLNETVTIMFLDKGIVIQNMDSCHVALINVKINKEFFKEYSITQEANIGIKLGNFTRILECIGTEEIVIEYDDNNPDVISIKSEYSDFAMNILDIESEEMEIPEMDFDVIIDADASVIQKYLKNMAPFGDVIKFHTQGDNVFMKTSGDIGEVSIQIHDQRVEMKGKISCEFASRYLVTFSKAAGVSKRVLIKMLNDQPGVFEYVFDVESNSKISFFLAPKISDDEDDED